MFLFSLDIYLRVKLLVLGLPLWLNSKESACNTGATGNACSTLGQEDPLEKEMAIRSSILAWEFLWTEEPGGLQSMGSKRVRQD